MRQSDATEILQQLRRGDDSAAERLIPLVYDQLRMLAGSAFRNARADHTLQPTALVHEVFLRLIDQADITWQDRSHFFAVSARAMRMILADYARRRNANKRGGDWNRVVFEPEATEAGMAPIDLMAINDALENLSQLNERHSRIVELRFFTGLNVAEIAHVMKCSSSTIERDWRAIRAWLSRELQASDNSE